METVEVVFDLERSKNIFKKYIVFEKRRLFKRIPSLAILAVALGFILLGLANNSEMLLYLGLIMVLIIGIVLLYYKLRFQSLYNRIIKELERSDLHTERNLLFKFDNERIYNESENSKSEITWKMIKCYAVNDGDIYLYGLTNELYDIISESIIGKERFDKFISFLENNVNSAIKC